MIEHRSGEKSVSTISKAAHTNDFPDTCYLLAQRGVDKLFSFAREPSVSRDG